MKKDEPVDWAAMMPQRAKDELRAAELARQVAVPPPPGHSPAEPPERDEPLVVEDDATPEAPKSTKYGMENAHKVREAMIYHGQPPHHTREQEWRDNGWWPPEWDDAEGVRPLGNTVTLPDPAKNRIGKFSDPAKSGAPETQRESAVLAYPKSGTYRAGVLRVIGESGEYGATDEDLYKATGWDENTVRPRRNELMNDGWIEDSGKRRATPSGKSAVVWRLTAAGKSQLPRHLG